MKHAKQQICSTIPSSYSRLFFTTRARQKTTRINLSRLQRASLPAVPAIALLHFFLDPVPPSPNYNPRRIRPTLLSPSLKILLLHCCCFIGLASPTLSVNRLSAFLSDQREQNLRRLPSKSPKPAIPANHPPPVRHNEAHQYPFLATVSSFVTRHSPYPAFRSHPPAESTSKGPRHSRPYFSSLPSPVDLLAKSLPHF